MKAFYFLVAVITLTWNGYALAASDLETCDRLYRSYEYESAYPVCLELAIAGVAEAQKDVGVMLHGGSAVMAADAAQAVEWYRKSAAQGHHGAELNLGQTYLAGEGVKKNPVEAQRLFTLARAGLEKDAAKGGYYAQSSLALIFYEGFGVKQDYKQAMFWATKAADQGSAYAEGLMGLMYFNGQGVKADPAEAVRWFRKSAEHGSSGAQFILGNVLSEGKGVEKDIPEGLKWLELSAGKGNMDAIRRLGAMYYNGTGVAQDYTKAIMWMTKAAERGLDSAQCLLALMYYEGTGAAKDYGKAAGLFRQSADQGDSTAAFYLGYMYSKGYGLPEDQAEAFKWYIVAALNGDSGAQNNLATQYENGNGVETDPAKALKWYLLSWRGKDEKAKENFENLKSSLPQRSFDVVKVATKAADSFRVPGDATDSKKWLATYRTSFKKAKSLADWYTFVVAYEFDDPDGLIGKAKTNLDRLWAKESEKEFKKAESKAAAEKRKFKAKVASFRERLKIGDFTNAGMVVEVRRPIVKIQTILGEHWFNIKQLYPPVDDSE